MAAKKSAGLTQFAYCSWPDALKTLSGKLTNDANAQKITGLINSKHYLDAARSRVNGLSFP